jgi:hypothetical protein
VHQAYIYGVNLTEVPTLKEKFDGVKKTLKETKLKKEFRKTMQYFRRMNIVNKKFQSPIP